MVFTTFLINFDSGKKVKWYGMVFEMMGLCLITWACVGMRVHGFCRPCVDSVIRVTRMAGDGRKEGAKHIKT